METLLSQLLYRIIQCIRNNLRLYDFAIPSEKIFVNRLGDQRAIDVPDRPTSTQSISFILPRLD